MHVNCVCQYLLLTQVSPKPTTSHCHQINNCITYRTTLLSMSTEMTGMPHTICSSWWYVRRERSGMGMIQETNRPTDKQKDNQTYLTTLLSMSTEMTGIPHTICSSWWYVRRARSGMGMKQQTNKQTNKKTTKPTWQLSWVCPLTWRAYHTPSALAGGMSGLRRGVGWGWNNKQTKRQQTYLTTWVCPLTWRAYHTHLL